MKNAPVKSISLRKKLVLTVFAVSSIATTLTVVISSFFDFRLEMSYFEKVITSVEMQNIASLEKLAWDLNEDQIQFQLSSIVKLPEVVSAKVQLKEAKESIKSSRDQIPKSTVLKTYPLRFKSEGTTHELGQLELEFDKESVVNKVLEKLAMAVLLNFVKALTISTFLMFAFQFLVTRRIEKLSISIEALSSNNFKGGYRPMKRNSRRNFFQRWDEINNLEHKIRRMSRAAEQNFARMENKISEQTDTLESQRAKAAYASKMASLGEMASGVAHEINNPLTIIGTRIQLLERKIKARISSDITPDPFIQSFDSELNKLMQLTSRISKIVKGLKFFARDGSKDPMEWVKLSEILVDSLQLIEQKIKSHGIEITTQIIDYEIFCRPVELSQVLLNLIGNSADAIAKEDTKWIKILSVVNDDSLKIEVIDSGNGINPEVQKNLMQPFFTTKPVGKGTGLGLSISKGIIEAHNGVFKYNTESQNTCFQIVLPLAGVRPISKTAQSAS